MTGTSVHQLYKSVVFIWRVDNELHVAPGVGGCSQCQCVRHHGANILWGQGPPGDYQICFVFAILVNCSTDMEIVVYPGNLAPRKYLRWQKLFRLYTDFVAKSYYISLFYNDKHILYQD